MDGAAIRLQEEQHHCYTLAAAVDAVGVVVVAAPDGGPFPAMPLASSPANPQSKPIRPFFAPTAAGRSTSAARPIRRPWSNIPSVGSGAGCSADGPRPDYCWSHARGDPEFSTPVRD